MSHPNQEVLDIFEERGMDVFRTDGNGNVVIVIDSNGIIWLSHTKNS